MAAENAKYKNLGRIVILAIHYSKLELAVSPC